MKYILQIFTGGWNEPNYTAEKIIERLKMLIPRMDIAPTDPEYVRESLRTLSDSGIKGAVLSWNVMLAPDAHFPFSDRETDDVCAL